MRPELTGTGAAPHSAACRRTFRRRSEFPRPDRLWVCGRLERPWTPQDPGTVRAFQRAGAGGALLLLIAACSGQSSPPPITTSSLTGSSSSAEGGTSVDCNPIDNTLPPSDRLVVLGSVALPNPALAAALGTARVPNPTSPVTTFFAKDGLGVAAGTGGASSGPQSAGLPSHRLGLTAVPGLEHRPRHRLRRAHVHGLALVPGRLLDRPPRLLRRHRRGRDRAASEPTSASVPPARDSDHPKVLRTVEHPAPRTLARKGHRRASPSRTGQTPGVPGRPRAAAGPASIRRQSTTEGIIRASGRRGCGEVRFGSATGQAVT